MHPHTNISTKQAASIAFPVAVAGFVLALFPLSACGGLIAHFTLDSDGTSADGKLFPSLEEDVEFDREGATPATGTAALFNGFSSRIQHDLSREFKPESFSLAFWARTYGNTEGVNSAIASLQNQDPDSRGFSVYTTGSPGNWMFSSGNGTDSGNLHLLEGPPVKPYEWQHIVVTYENDEKRKALYVDGVEVASAEVSVAPNLTMPFNIGAGPDFGDAFQFKGEIDDIGFWDDVLTAEQITVVMNSGVAALESDPRLVTARTISLELTGAVQNFTTQVTNFGQSNTLEISSISFAGNDAGNFSLTTPETFALAPRESAEIGFRFTPSGITGNIDATLIVVSNDPSLETFAVQLSGLIQDPRIEVADANVDFGSVPTGRSSTKSLIISNIGSTKPLTFESVEITGPEAARFAVQSLPGSILPGMTGEIMIVFTAAVGEEGDFSAWLEIRSDDPGAPVFPVPLLAAVPVTDANPIVAYWPLDEEDGSDIVHDLVRGREGAVTDVLFGASGAHRYTGTAAYFDGANSRIQMAHSMDLNPLSFTLTAWAKPEGAGDEELWSSLVGSRYDLSDDGERSEGYAIQGPSADGVWSFWSGNGGEDGNWQLLDGPKVTTGKWQHIAVRYDDSLQRKELFVNGKSVAAQNARIEPNTATPFNIGAGEDFGTDHWFEGYVDELALFRTALSASDINYIYVNGVQSYIEGVSVFQIVDIHIDPATNEVALTFTSGEGRSYRLERSDTITDDSTEWVELADGIDAEGPLTTVSDTSANPESRQFYYRISLE
ncbi:MAG: LamG-like jellyroll fold domain-containing protein [Verrucomicrobiales bacterium]